MFFWGPMGEHACPCWRPDIKQASWEVKSGPKNDMHIVCPEFWVYRLVKFRPAWQHRISPVLGVLSQEPPRRSSLKDQVSCCHMHI